jgi:MoaA/NifB/PqqE/SkfB family radical SAM enzyme
LRLIAAGLTSTRHPVLAHLIPMRKCNLSCTYCNEFDRVSAPVETAEIFRRVDRLAELGTSIITISGGEPLLHPDLDAIIRHIRKRGIIAGLITNAYLLGLDRVERLNRAGLDYMQISIDNVIPDEVSKKSLKVLDKKLRHLAAHAEFGVNINSVLGAGTRNPEDALTIARRAQQLGFSSTVGIIHDGNGQLRPLGDQEQGIFQMIMAMGKRSFTRFNQFQQNIARAKPNQWRCRAGARYLYICEKGLVHYCSQQRGYPGVSLFQYGRKDLEREYYASKSCAPFCTVSCVQQVAMLDNWRAPQAGEDSLPVGAPEYEG